MANRILLGATPHIIDWAESGSTSTTAGTVGAWPEDGFYVRETAEGAQFTFLIGLEGLANEAAVRAALDALELQLIAATGDVVVEHSTGNTMQDFKTSTGAYNGRRFEFEKFVLTNSGLLTVTVIMLRPALSNPGLGAGALDVFNWQYEQSISGIAAVIGTLAFATKAAADTFVTALRAGARPSWCSASMKLQNIGAEMEEPVTGEYRPCKVTCIFASQPAWAAALTNVKEIMAGVKIVPMALNKRSRQEPGYRAIVAGYVDFKTENENSMGSAADSGAIASAQLRAEADTAIDAIVAEASARSSEGVIIELSREYTDIDVKHGRVSFEVQGVTGSSHRIMLWDEKIVLIITDQSAKLTDSDGKTTRMQHAAGDLQQIQRTITIQSLGFARTPPRPVQLDGRWKQQRKVGGIPEVIAVQDGEDVYEVIQQDEWERDN